MGKIMCDVKFLVFLSLFIGHHVCETNSKTDEGEVTESPSLTEHPMVPTRSSTDKITNHKTKDPSTSFQDEGEGTDSPSPTERPEVPARSITDKIANRAKMDPTSSIQEEGEVIESESLSLTEQPVVSTRSSAGEGNISESLSPTTHSPAVNTGPSTVAFETTTVPSTSSPSEGNISESLSPTTHSPAVNTGPSTVAFETTTVPSTSSPKSGFNASCSTNVNCKDGLVCNNERCLCGDEYYWNENETKCLNKSDFNVSCSTDVRCKDGLVCNNYRCLCNDGYYWDTKENQCLNKSDFNVSCSTDISCKDGLVCNNNRCLCNDGYYWDTKEKQCLNRPANPVCSKKFFSSFSTTSITLNLTEIAQDVNSTHLWIEIKNNDSQEIKLPRHISLKGTNYTFTGLNPDTYYTFSIFAAILDDSHYVRSLGNCTLHHLTYPMLNCSTIKRNESSLTILQNGLKRFNVSVATSSESRFLNLKWNNTSTYNLHLQSGVTYNISIVAQGNSDLWTPSGCSLDPFVIDLDAPECNTSAFTINTNSIILHTEKCQFENGSKKVHTVLNGHSYPEIPVGKDIDMKQSLKANIPVDICIYAIGENGADSLHGLCKELHTRPSDLNCNLIKNKTTNDSLTFMVSEETKEGVKLIFLGQNETKQMDNTTVTFSGLNPAHIYDFTVRKLGGGNMYSENNCSLSVETRPNDPDCTGIRVSDITNHSMITDLSSINATGATYYKAYLTSTNAFYFGSNNTFRHEISNLTAGTEHSFNVSSFSKSDIKSLRSCVFNQYTKPAKPKNFQLLALESSYFNISWSRGEGRVDFYNISVNCSCEQEQKACTPSFPPTESGTSMVITGLNPGSHCRVFIIAVLNTYESDMFSTTDIETNETAPEKVSSFESTKILTNLIKVAWTKPRVPNGDIKAYLLTIEVFDNDSPHGRNETNVTDMSTPEISYTFENLIPGTCYNITVAAINDAGKGYGTTISRSTYETEPGPVSNLSAANASSTSINVSWSSPKHPNGVIIKYEIQVGLGSKCIQRIHFTCSTCQSSCVSSTETKSSADKFPESDDECHNIAVPITEKNHSQTLQYYVQNLSYFQVYDISVWAFTAVGGGTIQNTSCRTSADRPSEPTILQKAETNSSITLNVKEPKSRNGILNTLEVEYSFKPYTECTKSKDSNNSTLRKIKNITKEKEEYEIVLENLKPFWEYFIRARMATYAGYGNYSEYIVIRTLSSTPGKISNLRLEGKTSRSIRLSWKEPCFPNGEIEKYIVTVQNQNNTDDIFDNTTKNNSILIKKLLPYRGYTFKISTKVFQVETLSESFESSVYHTDTEAPYQPRKFECVNKTAFSFNLTWKPPFLQTGPTHYVVNVLDVVTRTNVTSCESRGFQSTSCMVSGLDSFWNYTLTLSAITEGFSPNSTKIVLRTKQSAPGKVSNFSFVQEENVTAPRAVYISWESPTDRDKNGIINHYYIIYRSQSGIPVELACNSSEHQKRIVVEAQKTYTFQLFASTIANASKEDYAEETIKIKAGAPLATDQHGAKIISKDSSSAVSDDRNELAVSLNYQTVCDDSNGNPVKWYIIVAKDYSGNGVAQFHGSKKDYEQKIKTLYRTWKDVYENDDNHLYIATNSWFPVCHRKDTKIRRAAKKPFSFIIGAEGDCTSGNEYCNGKLEPNTKYRARVTVCTEGGCLESPFSETIMTEPNLVPLIAGSVSGVVVAIVLVLIIIVYLHRTQKGPFKKKIESEEGLQNGGFESGVELSNIPNPRPVKIADFDNHVQRMHADSNLGFSQEYKLIKENCATHSANAAEVQVNRIKNRYTNILAYDHSRVKLLPTEDDEGSDYINANYIPGFSSPREYIATQGPLPFTRDEFWRMVWEQNVSIVVMLTQLVERGRRKCDIYWPETAREPVYYGDLVVEIESESTLPDYVLRVMSVKLGDSRKTVKHFSYLAWPDMGIPETSETMLKFTKEVRSHLPPSKTNRGPLIVHCSAGVGRTGTFIAVDYLMQHVNSSDVIDIYSYVMKMRNNRPNMVQTEDQYVFIHDCIRDFIKRSDEDSENEEEDGEEQEGQAIYENV